MFPRIGFMQGRLSPLVDGRIQAFPWPWWQGEFQVAHEHRLCLIEWTLDQDRLYDNPLMTVVGRREIRDLSTRYGIQIPSLTGDCFMQAPFWKERGAAREMLLKDFESISESAALAGISIIVVPLVDDGRLENSRQEDELVSFFQRRTNVLMRLGIRISFESDFSPLELARFIDRLVPEMFGVNYDIGNSAALGFDLDEEMAAYGQRIVNVHVKDRLLGGGTVPLGTGNACIERVFSALATFGYKGNFILQTARAADSDHAVALCRYRDMVAEWMTKYGL